MLTSYVIPGKSPDYCVLSFLKKRTILFLCFTQVLWLLVWIKNILFFMGWTSTECF